MTRITNFGRKKTYLKAGFGDNVDADNNEATRGQATQSAATESSPSKRRRKRQENVNAEDGANTADEQDVCGGDGEELTQPDSNDGGREVLDSTIKKGKKAKTGLKKEKMYKKRDSVVLSEKRRLNRIAERKAETTCLRCRQKGHMVKECPNAGDENQTNSKEGGRREQTNEIFKLKSAPGVGICYRCGSRRHNLFRCKKPVDLENSLPFASCFVCSKTGHLASTCPQNQGKGIYPNGGSCKLCKQTDHLAKDCPLKSKEMASKDTVMLGDVRTEGGADEDDFHVIKRRRDAVQKEEMIFRKQADKVNIPKRKVVQFNG